MSAAAVAWITTRLRFFASPSLRHSTDAHARLIRQEQALSKAYRRVRARSGRGPAPVLVTEDGGIMDALSTEYFASAPSSSSWSFSSSRYGFAGYGFDLVAIGRYLCDTMNPTATTTRFVRFTRRGDRTLTRFRLEFCPAAACSISALHKPNLYYCEFAVTYANVPNVRSCGRPLCSTNKTLCSNERAVSMTVNWLVCV